MEGKKAFEIRFLKYFEAVEVVIPSGVNSSQLSAALISLRKRGKRKKGKKERKEVRRKRQRSAERKKFPTSEKIE